MTDSNSMNTHICHNEHRGFYCTLPPKHDGAHEAHGTAPLLIWNSAGESRRLEPGETAPSGASELSPPEQQRLMKLSTLVHMGVLTQAEYYELGDAYADGRLSC